MALTIGKEANYGEKRRWNEVPIVVRREDGTNSPGELVLQSQRGGQLRPLLVTRYGALGLMTDSGKVRVSQVDASGGDFTDISTSQADRVRHTVSTKRFP